MGLQGQLVREAQKVVIMGWIVLLLLIVGLLVASWYATDSRDGLDWRWQPPDDARRL